jgi:anti-anti-sigma factor
MAGKSDLSELLVIHLRDCDVVQQDAAGQIRDRIGFIVDTASISQLLIDLSDVTFLSSSAIGQLIMLKKKCDLEEIALALCNIAPDILRVLRLVRCDEVIDMHANQWEAIESLRKTLLPAPLEPLPEARLTELEMRAGDGNRTAMLELGMRFADGMGLPQDWRRAVHWYRRAASHGEMDAQYELATCLAFGLGVPQSYEAAVPWYEQAAGQGHADAQYMLGMTWQYGLAGISDSVRARHWYQQASLQGNDKATAALQNLTSVDTSPPA